MPILLQQGDACQGRAIAYAGLLTAHRQVARGRVKVGRGAVRKKLLVYAHLLHWCMDHAAVIKHVNRAIDYQPSKIFTWFLKQVTEARCTGDVDKSNALLGGVFKLLGNSGYGKHIEALERQTNVIYTKHENVVHRALRSAYFSNLDKVEQAYELESQC